MSASRKLYVALAEKYREQMPKDDDYGYAQWTKDVIGTASVLHQDNTSFNQNKFLTACGMSAIQARVVTDSLAH